MRACLTRHLWVFTAFWLLAPLTGLAADGFTVATFNLEQYGSGTNEEERIKGPEAKAKIVESILAMSPDVLAVQEIEGTNALMELRADLKQRGLDYPAWEMASGADPIRHVAVLSRLPIVERRSHHRLSFLLRGRRFLCSRGFVEVDVKAGRNFVVTIFAAHLKSRRQTAAADEADVREQEAMLLREIVDRRLTADPQARVIVAGDFNDTKSSRPVRLLIGRGKLALHDLRPAERNGDNLPSANPKFDPRNVTWTYYYGKEDEYSRIDYLLASRGLMKCWDAEGTRVLALPNWGAASDHRPIVARFMPPPR
jgi:endonuclease/exonuclease/phosphatase family metal-dependent hydrolase